MNKKIIIHGITVVVFLMFIVLSLASTATTTPLRPSSANSTGPRTIILNDEYITEKEVEGFISWFCYDYVNEKKLILEVGMFGAQELNGIGYVLYDGGYIGEFSHYRRNGLEHIWDWGGQDGTDYAFVIKSDGTGLYYDFTRVKKGESTKPRDVFKCYKK